MSDAVNRKNSNLRKMTAAAMLTALVIILQLAGSFIRFGTFSITLTLVPIVVGAAICGPVYGAWLGLVFGLTVLLSGDATFFMNFNPAGTVIVVLLKGILCGWVSGLVYRLIEGGKQQRRIPAGIAASVLCPVLNTGVFFLGCLVFFGGLVEQQEGYAGSVAAYSIIYFIGLNFIVELAFNAAMSFIIIRLIELGKKILKIN